MEPIYWSIALLLIGLFLVILELFIPSGGILSIGAAVCLVGSIVTAFFAGPRAGVMMLTVNLIVTPLSLLLALKVWPHTPMGKSVMPDSPTEEDVKVYDERAELVGRHGEVKTKMLPSGIVQIDGQSYDAVSESDPLEPNQIVEVVSVSGNRMVVRRYEGPIESPIASDPNDNPLNRLESDPFEA
ncbi:MAG: NfeD family protein [Pirellulaceae bacterium]|jgi:membrane-bound ClpP family serine protease|nr:NfeD family protein [Pirellulaceae bacterium]MDP7018669.1 NfeD family protein [Pirellulaceae bacterium]